MWLPEDGREFVALFSNQRTRNYLRTFRMARDVVATLNALIAEKSLLKHSFYRAWTAGELPIERLREYAVRYYPHVAAFPRYLSAIHSRCGDIATRQALLENLIEEERGEENHPELWLRFAQALGVDRERVAGAPISPAIAKTIATFEALCAKDTVSGLAAIYAYEAQIPAVASAKIDGLRRFYGIAEESGVAFFRVHEQADVWHARADAELIERHCGSAVDSENAVEAGQRALDALWSALDSM
jgi:pyrroloquinoline-quinone synthase